MSQVSPRTWQLIAGLLAMSALLKLYHLTAPALDWQSWNQISTLATARYVYRDGLSAVWVPRVDLFVGLETDSNKTFAEFPLLHVLMALGYWVTGGEADWVGRAWNILFSLLGGVYLARLAKRDLTPFATVAAVALYALSPSDLYFHRTLKTDIPFCAFMVAGLYYFVAWLDERRARDAVLAGVAIALAALFKAYALYMGAAFAYLLIRRDGWRGVLRPWSLAIAAICAAPILAWVAYGLIYLPDTTGGRNLVTSSDLFGDPAILLRPAYYNQLLTLWFGFTLTPLVGLCGLLAIVLVLWRTLRRGRTTVAERPPLAWPEWLTAWWLGVLVYVVIVRGGNWQHDYYQIPILPPLAVTGAVGLEWVWRRLGRAPQPGGRPGALSPWRWAIVGLLVLSAIDAGVEAKNKSVVEWDSYSAGRAVAAVRQSGEYTLYVEKGGLRHQQALHYTGGPGWRLPDEVRDFSGLLPFYSRGGRYLLVSMLDRDWQRDEHPIPLVTVLLRQGHLEKLAEQTGEPDRYGRPRHWAAYRIKP